MSENYRIIEDGHLGGCVMADAEHPHGDPHSYLPKLWDWLIERFDLKTVLDVGCGQGHAVKWFRDRGIAACGIEGSLKVIRHAESDAVSHILWHDFTEGPTPTPLAPRDLVWCCEFVEHVEEQFIPNYLPILCSGKVLAITHALPGQDGYHRVTCRDDAFWIDTFERQGTLQFSPELTEESRRIRGRGWWGVSGLLFVRRRA